VDEFDDFQDIENPEKELARLDRVIAQYRLIVRTTSDLAQQDRAKEKLKALRSHRKKLIRMFDLEPKEQEDDQVEARERASRRFLGIILREGVEKTISDPEVNKLTLYLRFFDAEFLSIFSERKLRLDFQHSLERDAFFQRLQDTLKKMKDLEDELEIVESNRTGQSDIGERKKRVMRMKRALTIEASRLFNSIVRFAAELVKDIEEEGLKCLNGNEIIRFEELEGKRYLEGKTIKEALMLMRDFALEVIEYLNIPDFYGQE